MPDPKIDLLRHRRPPSHDSALVDRRSDARADPPSQPSQRRILLARDKKSLEKVDVVGEVLLGHVEEGGDVDAGKLQRSCFVAEEEEGLGRAVAQLEGVEIIFLEFQVAIHLDSVAEDLEEGREWSQFRSAQGRSAEVPGL